ncbi:MAG: hypothetical protein QM765_50880 [Myxococcales bacterium]
MTLMRGSPAARASRSKEKLHLPEADPVADAGQVAVVLGQRVDDREGAPVDEREVAGAGLQPGELRVDLVEGVDGQPPRAGLGAALLGGEDDLRALPPLGEQLRDELGRVLQVAVHQHDDVALGVGQPRRHRRLQAEVARQADDLERRVGLGPLGEQRPGLVAAAVVHGDDLELAAQLRQRGEEPVAQLGNDRLLVEERDDDAQELRLAFAGLAGVGGIHRAREYSPPLPGGRTLGHLVCAGRPTSWF